VAAHAEEVDVILQEEAPMSIHDNRLTVVRCTRLSCAIITGQHTAAFVAPELKLKSWTTVSAPSLKLGRRVRTHTYDLYTQSIKLTL